MSETHSKYDVFISYAREDMEWVRENLYEPLKRCRTRDGRSPHIFFDVSDEGIRIGENWMDALERAIQATSKFVPVYSKIYFTKPNCKKELQLATTLDPEGQKGLISPILVEHDERVQVPFQFTLINYMNVASTDWFNRLCDALDLGQVPVRNQIKFLDLLPAQIVVNHTLPALRVAVTVDDVPSSNQAQIRLQVTQGLLQGTVTRETVNGVATFDDISFGMPVSTSQLIAEAEGAEAISSATFAVLPPPIVPKLERVPFIPIEDANEFLLPIFFRDAPTVAVISQRRIDVYNTSSQEKLTPMSTLQVDGPIRFWRRGTRLIALADWEGSVHVVWQDGRHGTWKLGDDSNGFTIPGDIAFDDDSVYVGMWSGRVYRLAYGQPSSQILSQTEGVQAMAYTDARFYLCGFDGMLNVYQDGRRINGSLLEQVIYLLQPAGKKLLAVGAEKLYQIQTKPLAVVSEPIPLADVYSAVADMVRPVIVDSTGGGICIDSELTIRSSFRTGAGANPLSADDAGQWRVFSNPDGSNTLMLNNRVVFANPHGALAVSPTGKRFAVGDSNVIRILSDSQIRNVFTQA